MSYAILSDIHANLEALQAVLDDLESFDVDRILCLGDVIGYGPNPCETLKISMDIFEFVLKGNHEHAVLFNPAGFNKSAAASTKWTRDQINDADTEADLRTRFWNFLGGMDEMVEEEEVLYVHATPVSPITQYLVPEDVHDHEKIKKVFDEIERVSFGGHTHIPGVFEEGRDEFLDPKSIDQMYTLNDRKVHINVGSVGQPRDGIRDSSYVIVDGNDIHFRRVPYEVKLTAKKIMSIDRLSNSLGSRLLSGK